TFLTTGLGHGPVSIQLLNDQSLQANTPYSFTIATSTGGFFLNSTQVINSSFASTSYTLSSSNFAIDPNSVSLDVVGSNLNLAFTTLNPVPEPATVLAIAAGALGLGHFVRRRLRRSSDESTLAA